MKSILFVYLISINFSLSSGLDYILVSDTTTDSCKLEFPYELGYFAERAGKYGDNSEFKQIETILDINLDVFNHMKYLFSEEGEPKVNWFNIDSMIKNLTEVVDKINEKPNFWKEVIYDSNFTNRQEWRKNSDSIFNIIAKETFRYKSEEISKEEYDKILDETDLNSLQLEYPVYDDYLEKGSLTNDLWSFIQILNCQKKYGGKQIGIIYM